MRDGRVSQRAAVKIVSRRPGSQRDDGLNRGFQIWIVGCYYERQAVSCDGTLSEERFLETKVGARRPLGAVTRSSLEGKARPKRTCRAIASSKSACPRA
jgi:hypothetical protein